MRVIKKLFSIDKHADSYEKYKKNKNKVKRNTLIMVLFLFGINAFAWFTYIANADFNFDAKVIAWDVNFYTDSTEVIDVIIDVGEIYPGFGDTAHNSDNLPYKKVVEVGNLGEINAAFKYEVKKFTILGQPALVGDYTNEDILKLMESYYPFTIKMSSTADKLAPGENLKFEFELFWLFEDGNKYYKLNQLYEYDPSFVYYTYSNNTYEVVEVDETTYPTLRDQLYLQKDDADSYFGQKCAEYEAESGEKCVSVDVKLNVSQLNEEKK